MRRADIILENSRKLRQVLNKDLPAQKKSAAVQPYTVEANASNHQPRQSSRSVSGNGQLQWKLLSSNIIVSV